MYFKLFKLTNWRKITGESRRQIVRYCLNYSYRSASMGSILAALLAG